MPVYVSDLLTATAAPVSAAPSSTRTWQWLRGSTSISGATTTAYTATTDDIGSTISARQTETNFLGSATATSAATETVEAYNPAALFRASEPGVWYDPNDLSTLFQDAAGTIPVTGPTGPAGEAIPVGLMLDKSRGLVLGPELVTNGDFAANTVGWSGLNTGTLAWSSGRAQVTSSAFYDGITQTLTSVVGKFYAVSVNLELGTAATARVYLQNSVGPAVSTTVTTAGVKTITLIAQASTTGMMIRADSVASTGTFFVDNVTVKELPGNHATQATEANKPIYGVVPAGGRRNLQLWTEDFSNAVWGKFPSPGLTLTNQGGGVWRLQAPAGIWSLLQGIYSLVINTFSIEVKSNGAGLDGFQLMMQGAFVGGNRTATSDWVRYSASGTNGGSGAAGIVRTTTNDAVDILIRFPQFELGPTATPYQKVTNQYGVTEAGVTSCGYLFFDGVNDSMVTSTITPGTDKAQVFAGVRKVADGSRLVAEFSADAANNAGAFYFVAGTDTGVLGAQSGYSSLARGNAAASVNQTAQVVALAPDSAAITVTHDIAGDLSTIRRNGIAGTSATADKGTGNFLAYPLYLGSRAGSSLFLSGQLFPLIVRFGPNLTAARISATELWVGERTSEVDIPKSISPNIYTRSGDTILDRANSTIERRTV